MNILLENVGKMKFYFDFMIPNITKNILFGAPVKIDLTMEYRGSGKISSIQMRKRITFPK